MHIKRFPNYNSEYKHIWNKDTRKKIVANTFAELLKKVSICCYLFLIFVVGASRGTVTFKNSPLLAM